ncbi:MAG: DnaA/Hda family protein [Asticcacaulis sp.]
MPKQIPLDLETPDRYGRDRLVVTPPLQAVLDVLLAPQDWLSPSLVLFGPKGSGKTHLGHIFAAEQNGVFQSAAEAGPSPAPAIVVDDADQASEDTLFHLSNHVQSSGQKLVLLTQIHPRAWQVRLPDLVSRLNAMRLLTLPEPDADLLAAILKKLFAQRAISPSPDTLAYLANRMERSVAAAQKIVTELEYYANGRAFNRALVRDFFEQSETLFDDRDFE